MTAASVLVVAGPTAGGKSARALSLAKERGGIIINADSMQLYDALPILTAQPSEQDRAAVLQVLYAAIPPRNVCSAQIWRERALQEIEKAHSAGALPIVVGGTGFYIRALMQGLSPVPEVSAEVRAEIAAVQKEMGNPAFHAALAAQDPDMAARLDPNDTQRLIRAWEVLAATGKSLAFWQSLPLQGPPAHLTFEVILVMPERVKLYARCDRRFDDMMAKGALAEVESFDRQIRAGSVPGDVPVTKALGFRPLQAYVRGDMEQAEAVEQAKKETRNYAKRQVTWFRHQLKSDCLIES